MKILTFSDWRIQPLTMLKEIIRKEHPELILYAGDDLHRFLGFEKTFYVKTDNNFIEIDASKLDDFFKTENVAKNSKIRVIIDNFINSNSVFLNELKIPFVYANGNDDCLIKRSGDYYLKVSESFWIENEDQLENCSMYDAGDSSYVIERNCDDSDPLFRYNKDDGIYVKINPACGKTTYKHKSEALTIFGSKCTFGLKSQIVNTPNEHADIFLSHLPPLGVLDLSARFGNNHVGSMELLESINKHNPKYVICGHSHIWGGLMEKIDNTIVLNVSSQDNQSNENEGIYATINTDDWSYQIKTDKTLSLQKIMGFSTLKNKIKEKKIKLVPKEDIDKYDLFKKIDKSGYYVDVDPETIKKADAFIKRLYNANTIEEVNTLFEELESFGINTSKIKSRLTSRETGELQINKSITVNPEKSYFVDVETGLAQGPTPGKVWLIGIGSNKEIRQFFYPEHQREFFKYLNDNNVKTLVSWTRYDQKALSSIFESNQIEIRFFDACQRTSNAVIWDKYQLHELYRDLFGKNRLIQEVIPGRIAGLYADHLIFEKEKCPYCSNKKDRIIDEIKKRNEQDILQMIEICKFLYNPKFYECPNCDFTTKHKKSLNRHIKNNVCKKIDAKITFSESDLENLAHFNEYNVFICNCGKKYLCDSTLKKKFILNHINYCPKFIFRTKNK